MNPMFFSRNNMVQLKIQFQRLKNWSPIANSNPDLPKTAVRLGASGPLTGWPLRLHALWGRLALQPRDLQCREPWKYSRTFLNHPGGEKNNGRLWISNIVFPQQRKLMGSSAQISSGVCRCGSQEQVPEEGSRRFQRVPVCAGVGSGGRFRWVLVCAGVGSGGNFQKVPEGSGEFQGFGRFRSGLLPCNLDRNSHVIVFEHLLVIILSTWAKPLRNKDVSI